MSLFSPKVHNIKKIFIQSYVSIYRKLTGWNAIHFWNKTIGQKNWWLYTVFIFVFSVYIKQMRIVLIFLMPMLYFITYMFYLYSDAS